MQIPVAGKLSLSLPELLSAVDREDALPPHVRRIARDPSLMGAIEKAVRGMLPHTTLGREQLTHLKVYAGSEHPHSAQKPVPFEITQVSQ